MWFRPGRGTIDQIWLVRQLIEKSIEHECAVHISFVDLKKAFDSVPREIIRLLLKERGIEEQVVQLIVDIHDGTHCVVKSSGGKSSKFEVTTGDPICTSGIVTFYQSAAKESEQTGCRNRNVLCSTRQTAC